MAIGAVALSFLMAVLASFYGMAISGLGLWHGFALYVTLGFLTLATFLMATLLAELSERY